MKNKLDASAAATATAYFASGDFAEQFREAHPNFPISEAYSESVSAIMTEFMAQQTREADQFSAYLLWSVDKGLWVMGGEGWTPRIEEAGLFTRYHASQIVQQQFDGVGGSYAPSICVFIGDLPEQQRVPLFERMAIKVMPMKGEIS